MKYNNTLDFCLTILRVRRRTDRHDLRIFLMYLAQMFNSSSYRSRRASEIWRCAVNNVKRKERDCPKVAVLTFTLVGAPDLGRKNP